MPKQFKLKATETAILAAAARRRNGFILPLPEKMDIAAAATITHLSRLLTAELLSEHPTKSPSNAWRTDEAGQHYTLRITAAGRAAIAVDPAKPEATQAAPEACAPPAEGATLPRGKLGAILAAVRQPEGAALNELTSLTGWQPHTVRASITRLRQSGFPVQMATVESGRRYVSTAVTSEGGQ